jgi:hypothetical protein
LTGQRNESADLARRSVSHPCWFAYGDARRRDAIDRRVRCSRQRASTAGITRLKLDRRVARERSRAHPTDTSATPTLARVAMAGVDRPFASIALVANLRTGRAHSERVARTTRSSCRSERDRSRATAPPREGQACETLSFGGFKISAMEETGLAGVRNLPPSPSRTEAGSRSRLVPSVRDTSRTMSVGELGPSTGSIVVPRGPDRARGIDEVGSIRLVDDPAPAAA